MGCRLSSSSNLLSTSASSTAAPRRATAASASSPFNARQCGLNSAQNATSTREWAAVVAVRLAYERVII
eukprot:scaffold135150_cov69-Phaeocystis_antarctica.AAC.5